MITKLIHCIDCHEIIPDFGSLRYYSEFPSLPGVEWASDDMDEQEKFANTHKGHHLEELHWDSDSIISDRPSHEPVKVTYLEATNGKDRFLIKRTRDRFDKGPQYQLIPGKLKISDVSLRIQEDKLRRQLSWQNGSAPFHGETVEKFIRAFREEVESINPDLYWEEMQETEEGENPLSTFGRLKEFHWEKVLERCGKDLGEGDWPKIKKFIDDNVQPGDVLSLLISRKVSVELLEQPV